MEKNKIIVREENEVTYLEWYPSVFNQKSKLIVENGREFREVVREGAWDMVDHSNTLATLYHNRNNLIGRYRAGTLKLTVDEYGLKASVPMGETQLHKDTIESVKRGDLDEGSFIAVVSDWDDRMEGGELIRYINKFDVLRDVSIVTEGAYANTNIIIREFMAEKTPEEVKREEAAKKAADEKAEQERIEAERVAKEKKEADEKAEVERQAKEKAKAEYMAEIERKAKEEAEKEVIREYRQNAKPKVNKSYQAIREAAINSGGTVVIERAAGDGDTAATSAVIPNQVGNLDIIGKAPIWMKMGVDFNPNAKGTYTLPYQDPIVAQKLAQLAAVTKDVTTPTGVLIQPARFTVQKELTLESLASATDDYLQKLVADMQKAADRKISAEVYVKALAGASEVAGVELTKAGFDSLQGAAEIDNDGAFMSTRLTFFDAKGVAIDAGSGRFLASSDQPDQGRTHDGVPYFYSSLFADGDNKKYVVYGDTSKIHVADYGMTEVIIDKFTKAGEGKVIFTVNKLANVALMNPNAFAKSPDLDPAA